MINLNISKNWTIKVDGFDVIEDVDMPASEFGALVKSGMIKDPLIFDDEAAALKVAEKTCDFIKTVILDEKMLEMSNIRLVCGGLDTLCEGWINGEKAFYSDNAHIKADFEIKKYLKLGSNEIRLRFLSAVEYIKSRQKKDPLPKNFNGIDGASYLRKPSCHFGWDWGPCIPYRAVIGDIYLSAFDKRIENIIITQDTSAERSIVTAKADNCDNISLFSPDGKEIGGEDGKFIIEKPELWQTREFSKKDVQPLYTVVFENGDDTVKKKIGLRSISLDTSPDKYGSNFRFILNGHPVFAKGANLIPFSALPDDVTNETVDYYLKLAVRSNFNMLRVWGGGTYANDYFLSRCDELGILVWQDFCYACLLYPFYENDFLENVLSEAKENVLRMTLHPSLALLCGNNEIEAMFSFMPQNSKLIKAYKEFFYKTLRDEIKDLTDVPYIPTSPLGTSPFKNNTADGSGDTHMWNVWHGMKPLNYYKKRYTRFLSEFGLESLPSMKAISSFADKTQYSLSSNAFMSHQKCIGGNAKMLWYLAEKFKFPEKFEDLPYLTGIVQAECIKNAAEHFRLEKGRCNGSLFWQYNDVWNAPSWSSVDYEGIPKALQYKSKDFYSPVALVYSGSTLYVLNDTLSDENITVEYSICNGDKNIGGGKISVASKADSRTAVKEIKLKKGDVLFAKSDGAELVFDNGAKLKKADISVKIDGNTVEIQSDTFVKNVMLEGDAVAKENYFSLPAGVKRKIEFDGDVKELKVRCENNIEYTKCDIKRLLFRFLFRLKPLNIGNAVFYRFN
ncbi:MAG: hypothetical protein K6F09_06260 [Clostridiales bacterium]|nr:hypothetical protein [Clostridiales bacterium]